MYQPILGVICSIGHPAWMGAEMDALPAIGAFRTRGIPLPRPGLIVRSVAAISYASAAVPVALTLLAQMSRAPWTTVPATPGWPASVALAGGVLLFLQRGLYSWALRRHNRMIRTITRSRELGVFLLIMGLAASPIGTWLAIQWLAHPACYRYGGALLVVISLLAWLARARGRKLTGVRGAGFIRGSSRILSAVRIVLLKGGMLAFFLAVVFQPQPELVLASTTLVAAETLPGLWGGVAGGFNALWLADIGFLLRTPLENRSTLRQWAYDAIATPRQPDDSLLRTLVTFAIIGVGGQPTQLLPAAVPIRLPQGAAGVEPLLSLVEQGILIIESEVLPYVDRRRRATIERRVASIRAYALTARAQAALHSGRVDEALAELQEAARRIEAMGFRNMAATAVLGLGALGALALGDPAARANLLRIAADTSLSAVVRRPALFAAALQAATAEEPQTARQLYSQAQRLKVRRADRAKLFQEMRSDRGHWVPVWAMRLDLNQQRILESYLANSARQQIEGVPFLPRFGLTGTLQEKLEIGRMMVRFGMTGDAVALLSPVVAEAERLGHPYTLIDASYQLATAQAEADPVAAYRTLHRAIDVYDLFRAGIVDDLYRNTFGGALTLLHLEAIRILVFHSTLRAEGWPEQPALAAFELAERARSRQMLELLSTATPPPSGPPQLVAEEQAATRVHESAVQAVMGAAGENRVQALVELRQARARLDEIWRELSKDNPQSAEYAQMRAGRPGSYESVRNLLETDSGQGQRAVLFEYHMISDGKMVLFVARADLPEPELVSLPVSHADILRATLAVLRPGMQVVDLSLLDTILRSFLEPVLKWAEEGDLVYFVPFGAMHHVPLHALTIDGRALIDRNPVCYVQSSTVLQHCRAKRTGNRRMALLFADSRADRPLPHARIQAAEIARLFGGSHATTRFGDAATASELRRMLSVEGACIDVLHVACHGEFVAKSVGESAILLAPNQRGHLDPADSSDRLSVHELMGLQLNADLVTLSACETGVSENDVGDELIGLTRAAIYAGSPSVVVSLWQVDELSTSMLMQRFYERLLTRGSKADALRDAQRWVRAITVAEVITYCSDARQRLVGSDGLGSRWLLARDVADARFRARDFTAALHGYNQLAEELSSDPVIGDLLPGGAETAIAELRIAQARCRRALRHPSPVDYDLRPFTQAYYWAPFVLVGDWR